MSITTNNKVRESSSPTTGTEKNVPSLRFADFSEDWEIKTLGNVTTYFKGFAFKSQDYRTQGTRIIRVSDLTADSIKQENENIYINPETAKKYSNYKIFKDDIIITTVGSKPELKNSAVGRSIYVYESESNLLNQNLLILRAEQVCDSRFVYAKLTGVKYYQHVVSVQRGNANQSNITVKDIQRFKLFVPTLPEQQKIASFLSSVDSKISLLQEKHCQLQQYKKGVMQQLFSQKPSHEKLRFTQADGSAYPDWEEKKLGDVAKRITQKNTDDAISRVLTNSATQGVLDQQAYFDKDIANANNLEGYYVVDIGDYVYNPRISVSAPVGPINKNNVGKGVMSPLYTVFRFNETNNTFFELYFQSSFWHKYMCTVANYGARHDRMNITSADFIDMPLPFPCIEEQQKIAECLMAIDAKIDAVADQLASVQAFKKGLLQKMFV